MASGQLRLSRCDAVRWCLKAPAACVCPMGDSPAEFFGRVMAVPGPALAAAAFLFYKKKYF